jgi:RND superfamily putative drug exporter
MGLLLMGVKFVQGLSVGAAAVVAVTVLASLTLLPALLGFAGERIERTRWRGLVAAMLIAWASSVSGRTCRAVGGVPRRPVVLIAGFFVSVLKREVPAVHEATPPDHAYRWSRAIQRPRGPRRSRAPSC